MSEFSRLWWPSIATTARIIEATKPAQVAPVLPDNDALRRALHDFHWQFLQQASLKRAGKIGRPRIAADLANHARAILEFFDNPPDGLLDLHLFGSCNADRDTFKTALRELADNAETVPTDEGQGGVKDWIADALQPIYRAHFGEPGYTSDDPVRSPYVNFVQAVGRELKLDGRPVNVSGEAIRKAVMRTRRIKG